MWVALTGTPGTGKTAVAAVLKKQGYTLVRLHRLAKETSCISGVDKKRKSQLIDVRKLNRWIEKNFPTESLMFFEGHISHLLQAMDKVIVLRCHPKNLEKRLMKKRWSRKKIKENVDAEALDIILCETVECHSAQDVFEIDTTNKTVDEVAGAVRDIVNHKFRPAKAYSIGQIDWAEEVLTVDTSKE
ncbi:MAG: adenylate kinase family protein [Candidatus Thermoplasmatota archaeon]|nr:adenylate kinase family protein [Candidatus Thermoplasmatota archaeon]